MLVRVNLWYDLYWLLVVCYLALAGASSTVVAQEKIYFTRGEAISRANLDGTGSETIYSEPGAAPLAIALALDAGRIYWCDTAKLEIRRSTLSGQNVEVLVTGVRSFGIALDPTNHLMYWNTDVEDVFPSGVYRSDMDGSNAHLVIPSNGRQAMGVALDTVNAKLYWTVVTGTPRLIQRANLDGTSIETVVEFFERPAPVALAIDVPGDGIYWAAQDIVTLIDGSVGRSRLDGAFVEVLSGADRAFGVAVDAPRGHVYWTSLGNSIKRANLDGSDRVIIDVGSTSQGGIAIDTRPAVKVPVASAWGLVALALAIAAAGTVLLRRQRRRACHAT